MKQTLKTVSVLASLSMLAAAHSGCSHRWRVVDDNPPDGSVVVDGQIDDLPIWPEGPLPPDGPPADFSTPSSPCKEVSPQNPKGHKPVSLRVHSKGDWLVALDPGAKYRALSIQSAANKMAAATIDFPPMGQEVAGFIISRDSKLKDVQDELSTIITTLTNSPPGGKGTALVRASGTQKPSSDAFPSVKGTIIDVTLEGAGNVTSVRDQLVASLLGKSLSQLGNLPPGHGKSDNKFVLRFVTLKRYLRKINATDGKPYKDKDGYSLDAGTQNHWRVVVMGAVARKAAYQNSYQDTGLLVDDLSNGTAFTLASGKLRNDGCEPSVITNLPVADIIWVVDESGSMSDNRKDIVNNANNFFNRAKAAGVDFRMGVTNVCTPHGTYNWAVGKFCSKISSTTSDDGGDDRFLLPKEQAIFSSCIQNPPGYEGGSEYGLVNARAAVEHHLPRAVNDPRRIRKGATLVIIVATDEVPNSLTNTIGYSNFKTCSLPVDTQKQLDTRLVEFLEVFSGKVNPEAQAMFHVIGGVCSNSCGAQVAHGYRELAHALGGQVGDVCQKNLGNTLQVIINSIVGKVSPVKMKHVPISSTLALSINGMAVKRSLAKGFVYNAASNSLAFINVPYKKGSKIVIGYKLWY